MPTTSGERRGCWRPGGRGLGTSGPAAAHRRAAAALGGPRPVDRPRTRAALLRDAARRLHRRQTNRSGSPRMGVDGVETRRGSETWRLTSCGRCFYRPSRRHPRPQRHGARAYRGDRAGCRRGNLPASQWLSSPGGTTAGIPPAPSNCLPGFSSAACVQDAQLELEEAELAATATFHVYGCRNDGQCNIKAEAVERVYVEKLFERLEDERFAAALETGRRGVRSAARRPAGSGRRARR